MRRLLALCGLVALYAGRKRLACALFGHDVPVRQFIGGHRCGRCHGAVDSEYVNPARRQGPRQERNAA